MRIVQFITRFDTVGGAQTHVLELSKALAREGHEVFILFSKGQAIVDLKDFEGIYCIPLQHLIHPIQPLQDLKALQETKRVLKAIKPDILALHSSKAGIIGRLAAESLHIPTVFTAHGWAFTEGVPRLKQTLYRLIEKYIGKKTSGIITVSKYDEQLALKNRIKPKYMLKTVHNGMYDSTSVAKNKDENTNIMMVARLQAPKRQDQLIHAFSQMNNKEAQLQLVGDGEDLEQLKRTSKNLQVTDRVHFLGARKDVPALLATASVFVLLSDFEGLPIAIIEAMACGLPIIASDVGGVKELITHGKNGFLVGKGEEETEKYLSLLMDNKKLREEMGECARKSYLEHFQFEKTYKETLSIYESILMQTGRNYDVSI